MVATTRLKNKLVHPAIPVMTEKAKEKAGIKAKRRPKKITKDETIRELQARIAALENPDEETTSKEPLFFKGSSPMLDTEDPPFAESEVPTEIDSDDQVFVGRKRTANAGLHDARALKRTKAYSNLEDVHPTLRNKPSGLKVDWHSTVSKQPALARRVSKTHTRSSSSSMISSSGSSSAFPSSISSSTVPPSSSSAFPFGSSPMLTSPTVSQSPPPESDFDHVSSLLAVSPPAFGEPSSSLSFRRNVGTEAATYQQHGYSVTPLPIPRAFKDKTGRKQQPGLGGLPPPLRENFRNLYIRRIIELVCLSGTPWNNPALQSLQREFNRTYPSHQVRLHSDDAVVVPTLRDVGVLRNRIGDEGLTAVIEYLPSQYNKRMLGAKEARAKYIAAVLADPQRPFIWEYFRPGTIPLPGQHTYYDEKRRGPFQSVPVLRAFSIYFTAHGIQSPIPFADPGDGHRPIGALALVATAVERAYRMHLTGDYISNSSTFSSSKWLATTDLYLDKIQNDLTSENWTAIFLSLHDLQESRARAELIQVGGSLVPRQRDALLPADPLTPPPLD